MRTYEIVGFGYWSSALFNDDLSGLDDFEEHEMNEWLGDVPEGFYGPVEMEELGFKPDVFNGLGGDAAVYTFANFE